MTVTQNSKKKNKYYIQVLKSYYTHNTRRIINMLC